MKGECDEAQRFWCNVEIGYIYYRYIIRYQSLGIQQVLYLLQIYNNIYLVRDDLISLLYLLQT